VPEAQHTTDSKKLATTSPPQQGSSAEPPPNAGGARTTNQSKLEALAAQLEDRRLGALALLLETFEKALQPKKAFDECPIESGLLCLLAISRI
jgi:hypothetical protein